MDATAVAFVSAARCTAVTLVKAAWSGAHVSVHQKCWKFAAHAGQPIRKMLATCTCARGERGHASARLPVQG